MYTHIHKSMYMYMYMYVYVYIYIYIYIYCFIYTDIYQLAASRAEVPESAREAGTRRCGYLSLSLSLGYSSKGGAVGGGCSGLG